MPKVYQVAVPTSRCRTGFRRNRHNLAIVELNTRQVVQVTRDAGLTNYGRWARDGDWIVFQSDRHAEPTRDESGVRPMLQNLEIWIVRRDGSGLRRLTTNGYFDAHPSW